MTRRELTASLFTVTLCLVTTVACAAQPGATQADADPGVVAVIGEDEITVAELDELAAGQLLQLRQQMYQTKRQVLEQEIYQRLLDEAAGAEDLTADEYRQREIEAAIGEPSEEQIQQVLNQYRARLADDDEQAREQVVNYLNQQARQKAEAELKDRLFASADVRIMLEPPRMEPSLEAFNPTRGPDDAPVTVVEYTDFQCPYCSRVQPTINQVVERYGDHVRHVFKNLPLPMHAQAQLAAEAGLCAADQGEFWQLHDWMFGNASNLSRESIVAAAGELGLDTDELGACLDNNTHAPNVAADMREARSFGITGTPGFLVNGRPLKGAQPFEAFAQIIDEELRDAGIEPPADESAEESQESAEASTDAAEPAAS